MPVIIQKMRSAWGLCPPLWQPVLTVLKLNLMVLQPNCKFNLIYCSHRYIRYNRHQLIVVACCMGVCQLYMSMATYHCPWCHSKHQFTLFQPLRASSQTFTFPSPGDKAAWQIRVVGTVPASEIRTLTRQKTKRETHTHTHTHTSQSSLSRSALCLFCLLHCFFTCSQTTLIPFQSG